MTEEQKEMRYVCFKTVDKVYGIDVCDLLSPPKEEEEQSVVSWDSLPPIPAAFKADLPAFSTRLVEFDSNFYLLGGVRYSVRGGPPSVKTFQLLLEENNEKQKQLTCKEVDLIPKPPEGFDSNYYSEYVEIQGDYYFIRFNPIMPIQELPDQFWALRSRTYDWKSLPPPPDLGVDDANAFETQHFVFGDKIYFQTIYITNEAYEAFTSITPSPNVGEFESVLFYSFDPFLGDGTWTKLGAADAFIDSFSFTVQGSRRRFHCPIMTLPLPDDRDYTFHLSTSHIEKSDLFCEWEHGYKATLHALLVNKRGVRFVQPIEGCFDGIQPAFTAAHPALVYLGNNMVCAMLIGFADEYHHSRTPLICLSVFHLSIMEDAIDMDYINSSASQKVQNFLTVNVKSRHVYSMVDYLNICWPRDDFYSFLDDIKEFLWMESKDPLFPVSKRPKLF